MGLFRKSRRSRRAQRTITVTPFSASHARSTKTTLSPGTRRAITLVLAGIVLYLFFAGPMGAWNLVSLWRTERALARESRELQAEIVELGIRRQKLESDTLYIERVAREEYHLAHPDELIYETE